MVNRVAHMTHAGMAGRVAGFARFLKERGFSIFRASVHDALRGLEMTGLMARDDMAAVLRANLVSSDIEWARFQALFDEYWGRGFEEYTREDERGPENGSEEFEDSPGEEIVLDEGTEKGGAVMEDQDADQWLEGMAYSPVSSLGTKDLGAFDNEDIRIAGLALKRMMEPFRINISRRMRSGRGSRSLDVRRTFKKSLKTEGFPATLFYREKKRRLKRLVLLADVSGSMDRYARFVLPFILGLRGVGARAEVFVFSTSLAYVTFFLRHLSIDRALEHITDELQDWSGGTRIGYSLRQFNENYAGKLLGRRGIVVILSDGWDLGGKEILRREMESLSRRAHSVIWLNPLAGDPDLEPLCQGMTASLPYISHVLPADSLESLRNVGRLLGKLMAH